MEEPGPQNGLIGRRRVLDLLAAATGSLLVGGCSDDEPSAAPSPTASPAPTPRRTTSSPTPTRTPTPTPTPAAFDPAAAFATVEHLATQIGPREAASAAFDEAAAYVQAQFAALGYAVTQQPVPVPAGDSWGVSVQAGTSANVIADPAGFDPAAPHVVIGAHLDTVAVAPGAEDNASGIGVMLDLARMAVEEPLNIPVRFVAFGAEEPRGRGDSMHHFGSQDYVAGLSAPQRAAIVAMVSIDRVGVRTGGVPIATGGTGTIEVMDALAAAATSQGIMPLTSQDNRASDHWSFEKADIPCARLGSVPYAGYHSADDLPGVVDSVQLSRVGATVWTWLRGL
ncbi:MAG: M28 family metallopeptidase [Jiangellaceae bacterium]